MAQDLMPAGPMDSRDVIIRDNSNPRALINLVPEAVQNAIMRLPESYVDRSEGELRTIFLERNWAPETIDDRLRIMFWKEYERAQTNLNKMHMSHVYMGICSRDYFYVVLQNKERVAWLLCPPIDYMIAAEEALIYGINQLRDILSLSHRTVTGGIDQKAAQVKVEIVKLLDNRVKGAVVQTTKNLNVNVHANADKKEAPRTDADLDKRLQELEQSLKELGASSTINNNDIEDAEVLSDTTGKC